MVGEQVNTIKIHKTILNGVAEKLFFSHFRQITLCAHVRIKDLWTSTSFFNEHCSGQFLGKF
ncbi:MAG TPA: hypothetical protein ACN46M_06990, partial [Prochlorococcus sp.]